MKDTVEIIEIMLTWEGKDAVVKIRLPGGQLYEVIRMPFDVGWTFSASSESIKRACSECVVEPATKDITITAQNVLLEKVEPNFPLPDNWPHNLPVHRLENVDNNPEVVGILCRAHPPWRQPGQTKLLDPNRSNDSTPYKVTCPKCLAAMAAQQCDEPVVILQGD